MKSSTELHTSLHEVPRTHYARADSAVRAGRPPTPLRSEFIAGFEISETEIADVVAFLESLTDERFLSEPRHRSPWPPATESAPTFQQPTKIQR